MAPIHLHGGKSRSKNFRKPLTSNIGASHRSLKPRELTALELKESAVPVDISVIVESAALWKSLASVVLRSLLRTPETLGLVAFRAPIGMPVDPTIHTSRDVVLTPGERRPAMDVGVRTISAKSSNNVRVPELTRSSLR